MQLKVQDRSRAMTFGETLFMTCEPLKNVMMFFLPAMVESTYCKLRKWKTIAAASWHFVWNFFEAEPKDPKNSPLKINGWKMKSLLERPGLFSGPMLPFTGGYGTLANPPLGPFHRGSHLHS